MNPKVNYVIVGLFVIAIFFATFIFALWLAFGYGETKQKYYLIYMTESVAGLSQDSPIKFNGVNVGSIKEIQLDPHNPSIVRIKIAVNDNTPVTIETHATLMSQGLTGLSYINLSGGNASSAPLKPAPRSHYAVIPTNPSLLVRLDSSVGKLSNALDGISQSVSYLLRDENQKQISRILKNIGDVTQTVADHRQALGDGLIELPKTIALANQAIVNMNTQTIPTLNQSLLLLQNAMPSISNFSQQLTENPSILLRGPTLPKLGPGEK